MQHPVGKKEVSADQFRIVMIVGSLRRDSLNKKLANAVGRLAPPEFLFRSVEIGGLPLYNQDDDANQSEAVKLLKSEIENAQGVLFVTPEYNRSIPGVLKNVIDHASRPYGQNSWSGKAAAVIGISVGKNGTAMAQQHLRNILAHLDMPTMGQPEAFIQSRDDLFDQAENLSEESAKFFHEWMNHYIAWVKRHIL